MTGFATYALYLVRREPNLAFYLGAGGLMIIGIVLTGFAGLLIKRTIKGSIGAASFEISDAVQIAATAAAKAAVEATKPADGGTT